MAIRIEDIIAFAGLENRNNNQQLGELIGCLEHQIGNYLVPLKVKIL